MTLEMGGISSTLESHLTTLLLHLLKYQYQTQVISPVLPEPCNCRDWFGTMDRIRTSIQTLIEKKPSLQRLADEALTNAYPKAKSMAIKDMNRYVQKFQQLNNNSYPVECPWTYEQVITEDWLPLG